jgi:hypothetical protein
MEARGEQDQGHHRQINPAEGVARLVSGSGGRWITEHRPIISELFHAEYQKQDVHVRHAKGSHVQTLEFSQ